MTRNQPHCKRSVIALLILTSSLVHAQDAAPSERETIQQLVQQVKELQDKVDVLESQQGSNANSGQSATPTISVPLPAPEEASNAERESLAQQLHELHGIQWRGFGEGDYKVLNQKN